MPDITMCNGIVEPEPGIRQPCPLREKCYRYKAKPSEYLQSYFLDPLPLHEVDGKLICGHMWRID